MLLSISIVKWVPKPYSKVPKELPFFWWVLIISLVKRVPKPYSIFLLKAPNITLALVTLYPYTKPLRIGLFFEDCPAKEEAGERP